MATLKAWFARSDRPLETSARATSKDCVTAGRLGVEIAQGQEKIGATYVESRRHG